MSYCAISPYPKLHTVGFISSIAYYSIISKVHQPQMTQIVGDIHCYTVSTDLEENLVGQV